MWPYAGPNTLIYVIPTLDSDNGVLTLDRENMPMVFKVSDHLRLKFLYPSLPGSLQSQLQCACVVSMGHWRTLL
jgi:hypothetical protein